MGWTPSGWARSGWAAPGGAASRRPAPAALLPPPLASWPVVLRCGPTDARRLAAPEAAAALARIRAGALFWPVPRLRAARPRVLAATRAMLALARRAHDDADIAMVDPDGRMGRPGGRPAGALAGALAGVDPERLEAVYAPPGALALWARIGGLACPSGDDPRAGRPADPASLLAGARGTLPWTGEPATLDDALDVQALLRAAALRARGPVALAGMSRWKRRCLRPFLTGPDGPPVAVAADAVASWAAGGAPLAVWGAEGPEGALRVEDGFLRSVGLGLRHTPPLSLTIGPEPPYFDATRRNGFEDCVAAAAFDPALLARARRLRERVAALGLTKYNVGTAAPLPDAPGRMRVLVAGQVAGDASLRLGAAPGMRDDAALLRATRARFPDAFLLYKPHPDTLAGLRTGRADAAVVAACADAVETRASADGCLRWADRVATVTSLIGFEALLRGRPATTFGRPFYAGWGLTDDADPPPRDRSLTLDELTAAALILHPDYVDPATGLPCTPEVALDALARQRAAAAGALARATRLWRDGVSWAANRLAPPRPRE